MDTREIRERNPTLGYIEDHIEDVRMFLQNDPNWMAAIQPIRAKKKGGKKRFPGTPSSNDAPDKPIVKTQTKIGTKSKRALAKLEKGERKRMRKEGARDRNWLSDATHKKRCHKVDILLPDAKVGKSLGVKNHIPIGEIWIHAGVGVFVRQKVYRHFEKVRRKLSDRMEEVTTEHLS